VHAGLPAPEQLLEAGAKQGLVTAVTVQHSREVTGDMYTQKPGDYDSQDFGMLAVSGRGSVWVRSVAFLYFVKKDLWCASTYNDVAVAEAARF